MPSQNKHIVFDCIGTLVSYSSLFNALESRLGSKLRAENIKPELLGHLWIEAAEREYTSFSISGAYKPFWEVFGALFWRMLWFAGVSSPRDFASEADRDFICEAYTKLEMRPGAKECFEILREGGFTVWGYTTGDTKRVGGYFEQAGVHLPAENLLSCDTYGVGKPATEAYTPILEMLKDKGEGEGEIWFAAAHMWDVGAAKRSGFKGAWCSILEREPCLEIFEEMDVMADSLPEMARRVVEMAK